ncbi:MAG: tetratricopeptide repeat protein, partial [Streptomyces sp.]|nr:tetratricopeptide repeat protein [Streptomyces sp.]
ASTYHQLGMVAQERGRWDEAEDRYRRALTISEELGDRPGTASTYHQLGMVAQERGRWDEAEDRYRRALTISEELGSRPGTALTRAQYALLAEQREQPQQALEWTIRCVALFDQIPHPAMGTGPRHLKHLTAQLGLPTLEHTWQQITGDALPGHVRQYVQTPDDPKPDQEGTPTP